MRKITRDAVNAFMNGRKFKRDNTEIEVNSVGNTYMRLHGNVIAVNYRIPLGKIRIGIYISDAGWQTNTTKERLNGIPGVHIVQKNFVWYLNGIEWSGAFIPIGQKRLDL